MIDASSESEAEEMTLALRSRTIKGIHYEPKKQRMSVLTAHGRLNVHENVSREIVQTIVGHDHPGYAYQLLRHEIGPKVSHLTVTGFFSSVAAKRAFKGLQN